MNNENIESIKFEKNKMITKHIWLLYIANIIVWTITFYILGILAFDAIIAILWWSELTLIPCLPFICEEK